MSRRFKAITRVEIQNMSNDELNNALQIALRGEIGEPIDYCRDLNALQMDEKLALDPEQWGAYALEVLDLMELMDEIGKDPTDNTASLVVDSMQNRCGLHDEMSEAYGCYLALTAPARQRAQALLWTLAGDDVNA